MKARLTRTGKLVLGVVIVGFVLGWAFGGRSLNVIVVPGAAALIASRLLVARYDQPRVTRDAPRRGHRGQNRQHRLSVEADPPYPIDVREHLSDGLGGDRTWQSVADGREFETALDLSVRGKHLIGPTVITARDPLGLFEVEFRHAKTHDVIVYPSVRNLQGTEGWLGRYFGRTDDRDRFDTVREYQAGDPLRDVNWKASAKYRGDLMVTEFTGDRPVEAITIGAEGTPDTVEEVAEAAASVAVYLLDVGLEVGVVTPTRHESPARGTRQQRQVLECLAVMEAGRLRDDVRQDVDFMVSPEGDRIGIQFGHDRTTFDQVVEQASGVTG